MQGAAQQPKEGAAAFLRETYDQLDFNSGELSPSLTAANTWERGRSKLDTTSQWFSRVEALEAAASFKADRVFFVHNDPVLVFSTITTIETAERIERAVMKLYREAWSMIGPRCLFVALPGELRVYGLTHPPAHDLGEWANYRPIEVITQVVEVATRLQDFHRSRVESGDAFVRSEFSGAPRADQQLLKDITFVRQALASENVNKHLINRLIGSAILIRYLEDRGVLTERYFEHIADRRVSWTKTLRTAPEKINASPYGETRYFDRVLRDKELTIAVFEQLAEDFRGDMFDLDRRSLQSLQPTHLRLLRSLLLGDASDSQQTTLFFWAYDFSIVPIELISNIYEEFYHDTTAEDDKGTHYTPAKLVDAILNQVLTPQCLAKKPVVLDPACGSGIFLVGAFRRIARYQIVERERETGNLSGSQRRELLLEILRERIRGIELNPEATRVAAFSLYLAFLGFLDPPSILRWRKLPHLIRNESPRENVDKYSTLTTGDAFALTPDERVELEGRLASSRRPDRTLLRVLDMGEDLPFDKRSFDVVVGNPPWDSAPDSRGLDWADLFDLPVGRKGYSQLFLHRATSLLKPGGVGGFLVSANVLLSESNSFRAHWLRHVTLASVVNYSHARHLYFEHAMAPFVAVVFNRLQSDSNGNPKPNPDSRFVYIGARSSPAAVHLGGAVLTLADRRILSQNEVAKDDSLWKTYWWGSVADARLIARLRKEDTLKTYIDPNAPGSFGFQRPNGRAGTDRNLPAPADLREMRVLVTRGFRWYGPAANLPTEDPPERIKRLANHYHRLFSGQRLVFATGMRDSVPHGRPVRGTVGMYVRLEYEPAAFRHTFYAIPLQHLSHEQAEVIAAFAWSTLNQYRAFMTSTKWGLWRDQLNSNDFLSIPIRWPDSGTIRRLRELVRAIREYEPIGHDLLGNAEYQPPVDILKAIDEAVYTILKLSDNERALVEDWAETQLDLIVRKERSHAFSPLPTACVNGTTGDDVIAATIALRGDHLGAYLHAFLTVWQPHLRPDKFRWEVYEGPGVRAIVFSTASFTEKDDPEAWEALLAKLSPVLGWKLDAALYSDAMVRVVTDTFIVIAKRDERRLWTKSAAAEDAEATLVQALHRESASAQRGDIRGTKNDKSTRLA